MRYTYRRPHSTTNKINAQRHTSFQEITPLSQHLKSVQRIFDLSSKLRHGKVRFGLGSRTYSVSLHRDNPAVGETCETLLGAFGWRLSTLHAVGLNDFNFIVIASTIGHCTWNYIPLLTYHQGSIYRPFHRRSTPFDMECH